MRTRIVICSIVVAVYTSVGLGVPVNFAETWEDDTIGSPPGSPWYPDPHYAEGTLSIGASVDRYHVSGKALLINAPTNIGMNIGIQAMLVPNGQEVEATDANKVNLGYWVYSTLVRPCDFYIEIALGDVHAPRFVDVGTTPLPQPIPVLAYCKPIAQLGVLSRATYYFDGRQWIPHGYVDVDYGWANPRMTVGANSVHLVCSCNNNPADVARSYLGRFDRVSIYTQDSWIQQGQPPQSTYIDELTIIGGNVLHALGVTPNDGLTSVGLVGGPFTPQCKTYTLTNITASPLNWSATNNQNWLNATPSTGTLAAGASVNTDVCINANANGLPRGTHTGQIAFTNINTGDIQNRNVELLAKPVNIFDFDVDGDVDLSDFGFLQLCLTGPDVLVGGPPCAYADLDMEGHVDWVDVQMFRACLSGPELPPITGCLTPAP